MSKVDIAVLIALFAAMFSAIGDVIRQRSAHEITDEDVGALELFRMSLRDRKWWLGGAAAIANYSLQAAALTKGSVVLVTAIQVTALLFALPIHAWLTKTSVTRREWMWAVVLAGALSAVIIVGDPASGYGRGSGETWGFVALVLGPTLVLCVLAARVWSGRPVAAVLLAVVAGTSLALFAVLTKGVVEVAKDGLGAVLEAPEFYPWLIVAVVGMVFQQTAFRAGALTASLPTMTVAKPVVAGAMGVIVLHETFNATGPDVVVLVLAVAVVIIATVGLARGEAASIEAEEEQERGPNAQPEDAVPAEGSAVGPTPLRPS
jgi:hypothetical protein